MSSADEPPRVPVIEPGWACPGGLVTLRSSDIAAGAALPLVRVGDVETRAVYASRSRVAFVVPRELPGGPVSVDVGSVTASLVVARTLTTGVHQVDNPAFDRRGRLYVTYSGSRGQQVPVSIFRVDPSGARESFSSAIVNPTSMTCGPDGALYVSSRFEGTVYRVGSEGHIEPYVTDVGVACGLAFGPDGHLFVGDRSGTVFDAPPGRQPRVLATLPPSIAAFHLAYGPDDCLYVAGPTLATVDSIYRVHRDGRHEVAAHGFGRPQGLAFDAAGRLHVADALAGASGILRVGADGRSRTAVAGSGLLGLAFGPDGSLVAAAGDTIYRFDRPPGDPPGAEDR